MSRVASAFLAAALGLAWNQVLESQTRESFDAEVPVAPGPSAIDGSRWLIYELHLTNVSREPLGLQKVDVRDGTTDRLLITFGSRDLVTRLAAISSAEIKDRIVQPGQRAIVYMEFPLTTDSSPGSLRHRIEYARAGDSRVDHIVAGNVVVQPAPRLALGPPLRGGPWAAIYHWQWPRGHRRVFYALDGRARLPGRLAIDWVKLDDRGRQTRGDSDLVADSLGYGVDVLAVANARVADVRDGVPESPRVSANPKHPLEEAAGNFIALDLGDGRFAVYEHLKPGSIRVARGERVRRGQVLASLGFTGDSTGPHLHFHVADGAAPLLAEGLPFVFDRFEKLGQFEDLTEFGKTRWLANTVRSDVRRRERPAPNAVVMFGDQ
jgi:murein DD-endopeptidase